MYSISMGYSFHSIQVCTGIPPGVGSYSNIIRGMGWVKDYVAQRGIKSAVVSISLSGSNSPSLNAAVQSLVNVSVYLTTEGGRGIA